MITLSSWSWLQEAGEHGCEQARDAAGIAVLEDGVGGTAVKHGAVPRVAHVEGQPYESEAVPGGVGVPFVRHLPECATWRGCRSGCPVSFDMRHSERHYLRCLKFVRRSAPSIVSTIMRQVRKSFVPSHQVSAGGASFR